MNLIEGLQARRCRRCASRQTTTGNGCAARSRPQRARANCGGPRIRSTPCCARTSRSTPSAGPTTSPLYGDADTGYILTPTLPAGLTPQGRRADSGGRTDGRRRLRRPGARLVAATDHYLQLVTALLDDAGINYLSITARTKSVESFAAKAERSRRRPPTLQRPAGRRSPTRSGCGSSPICARTSTRSRHCWPTRCGCSTTATWGWRRHAKAGGATPAGTCWSASRASSSPRRSRFAPCCSTRGRSSSTTSATRARFPPSTRPIWTAGSRWRPGLLELADREFTAIRERLLRHHVRRRDAPTTSRRPIRGSRPRCWRPIWATGTPTPAGRAPTTTAGSRGCCWNSASPRSTS